MTLARSDRRPAARPPVRPGAVLRVALVTGLLGAALACGGGDPPGDRADGGGPPGITVAKEDALAVKAAIEDGTFTWDPERFPALADIPRGDDGGPADRSLRPGPDGMPFALKKALGLADPMATGEEAPCEPGADGQDCAAPSEDGATPIAMQDALAVQRAVEDGTFSWDPARFPALAGIPTGDDGQPLNPSYRVTDEGMSESLKLRLGLLTDRIAHPDAPVIDGSLPEPPESLRCLGDEPDHDCYMPIPGGTTWLGAQSTDPDAPAYDPEAFGNEGPPQRVEVAPFWIMMFELDVSRVLVCQSAGQCEVDLTGSESMIDRAHQSYPARNLTHAEAQSVCRAAGGRLPTEAEWEHAAAGAQDLRYPWGDFPACGIHWQDGKRAEAPEAGERKLSALMRPPCDVRKAIPIGLGAGHSPFGVIGMGGNVAEWTADVYAPYGGEAPQTDGVPRHVVRGGGYLSEAADHRTTARLPVPGDARMPDVGFRCVWGWKDDG